MAEDADYCDDETRFPHPHTITSIRMLDDGSLDASVSRSDDHMHYHGTLKCPPGTKLYDYLIGLFGPLEPGDWRNVTYLGASDEELKKCHPDQKPLDNIFDFFKQ